MLPTLHQRLLIATTIALGGWCTLNVTDALRAPDGGGGLALLWAHSGPLRAALMLLVAALPALGLGLLASMSGHLLAGVFAAACALAVLAVGGGRIDGWLWRSGAPGSYSRLLVEMLLWQAAVLLLLLGYQALRDMARRRWPVLTLEHPPEKDLRLGLPSANDVVAAALCSIVAATVAQLLIRTSASGQVVGGLMTAFLLGALAARLAVRGNNVLGVLISPGLVAIGAYAYVLFRFDTPEHLLAAWYSRAGAPHLPGVPGLALALPIDYASAALAGCCLGAGLAQAIRTSETRPKEPVKEQLVLHSFGLLGLGLYRKLRARQSEAAAEPPPSGDSGGSEASGASGGGGEVL